MDQFLQIVLSNVFVALIIALAATVIGKLFKRPDLTRLLWLLVLVKLITPPVIILPFITLPERLDKFIVNVGSMPLIGFANEFLSDKKVSPIIDWVSFLNSRNGMLISIWILGSIVVLGLSLKRIYKFNKLLRTESNPAKPDLITAAERIAGKLNLDNIDIRTTSTHLSPMVWWTGGKVKVLMPTSLLDEMEPEQFDWILAHELAHVRRRDYLTRWLEWLTMVIYWWNPLTYWAIHNLRKYEELCCDALVINTMNPKLSDYTGSLLKAIEVVMKPDFRAPAMATEINSGGFMKKRFKLILSNNLNRSNLRWLQLTSTVCAFALLPLSISCEEGKVGITSAEQMRETSSKRTHQMEERPERSMIESFERIGVDKELLNRIRNNLDTHGINPDDSILGAMIRVIWEIKSEGNRFELDPRMREHFENTVQLTEKQIDAIIEIGRMTVNSMSRAEQQSNFR